MSKKKRTIFLVLIVTIAGAIGGALFFLNMQSVRQHTNLETESLRSFNTLISETYKFNSDGS